MKEAVIILKSLIDDENVIKHSLYAGMVYANVCNQIGLEYNEDILSTVIVHDIGKCKSLAGEGISEKGYRYFKDSPKVFARSIRNMHTGRYSAECNELETLVTTIIDYCDMHTTYDGKYCTIEEKVQEVGERCGVFSKEYQDMIENEEYYLVIDCDIKRTIKRAHELIQSK